VTITAQALGLSFPDVPGFKGQGWSTQETAMVVRWLFATPAAWDQAMDVARKYPGNPHTVADTLHEQIVPRTELDAIVTAGGDPAKVNWLEIAHELIERRDDPRPAQEYAGSTAHVLDLAAAAPYTGDSAAETAPGDFRRVVFTSPRSQMVVMTLNPGQRIGSEIHRDGDQLFMVLSGTGTATLNLVPHDIGPGSLIAVPAGTRHDVTAGTGAPLRLVTVYSPPQHPPGTVEHAKGGAAAVSLAAQDGSDSPAAAMTTARHLHDTGRHLTAASGHLDAAREAKAGDQDGHIGKCAASLDGAHASAHKLAAHLRAHYPAEAGDLDALTATIGLAVSVSDQAKTATTAHLTQTICNHLGHTIEHVKAMAADKTPKIWEFNWQHGRTHLDGGLEHAAKLSRHLKGNYPAEAKYLAELADPASISAQASAR